jgi:hypothetical protein
MEASKLLATLVSQDGGAGRHSDLCLPPLRSVRLSS